ncbi:MAG: putative holin [Desulfomicrobium sp.]
MFKNALNFFRGLVAKGIGGIKEKAASLFQGSLLPLVTKSLDGLLSTTRFQIVYCLIAIVALCGVVWLYSPQQLPVVLYKLLLAPLGGVVGGCVWLALVPIANPSRYLATDWREDPDADVKGGADFEIADGYERIFSVCVVCLALAFTVGMLAVGLGL